MSLPPLRTVLNTQSPTASLPSSLNARSSDPVWDGYAYNPTLDPHAIQLTISMAPATTTGSQHESTTSEEEPAPRTPSPTPATTATAPPMTVHTGEAASLLTGYRHVHRKPKAKRNRKGWGPYQSVTRERAVNFNLTLDVQNLKQEIQQLTTARDLLQSRMLQLRHSPTGSLMQMIREYYQIFRTGFRVEERGRRRLVVTAGVQRDFLYSVVDHNIDFGNGLRGVEFLVEMLRRYSQLMRFVSMDLESFTIIASDDGEGIVIETRGPLRLQILRETIATLFPHILGNEWLCSRLIGATVVAAASVTYHFNDTNRICLLVPDADYVAAFSQVLPDPQDVQELLGQSKIDDKSMLGVSEDGQLEHLDPYAEQHLDVYAEPEAELGVVAHAVDKENQQPTQPPPQPLPPVATLQPTTQTATQRRPPPQTKPQQPQPQRPAAHRAARKRGFDTTTADDLPPPDYVRVANAYILAFANGWPADDDMSALAALPRTFLAQHVSSQVVVGRAKGHAAIELAWRALGASFELLGFRATSQPQLYDDGETVSARVRVAYELAIDIATLQTVFPHVLRSPALVQALLGTEVVCPSELWFEWHDDDSRVSRVRERIDWDAALAPLLPPAQVRAFVLDGARLTPEGYVAVPV